jgi:hypothetical protein
MTTTTLLASACLSLLTAALALVVARLVLGNPSEPQAHARTWFASFWIGVAGVAAAQGARSALAYSGRASLDLIMTLDQVATPFYVLAAGGLVCYMLFVLTGRTRFFLATTIYYLVVYGMLRYSVVRAHPIGFAVRAWQVNLLYETPLQTPLYTLALALTAVPVLLAIAAYVTLYFRIQESPARYRIVCMSAALALWVFTELLAWSTGAAATNWGELARRGVGLASIASAILAYAPPAAVRRRWLKPEQAAAPS